MRILKYILVFSLAFCLLTASNCKKHPKPQKYLGTYPLGDIKDYLYFKPGSLWVYECDSTGELDTQVMVSCDTPWAIKSFMKYQHITFRRKSLNEGSIYESPYPGGDMFYNENYSYFYQSVLYRTNTKNGGYGSDAVFFKPYDSNFVGFHSSETHYKGLLTNYTVLGQTYDSVRVFEVKAGGTFPSCKIKTWNANVGQLTYYWAKGVGLVRLFVWTKKDDLTTFKFNWLLKEYKLK